MLSLQELSDRIEIQGVIAAYSTAVDNHEWTLFDQVFTPDCDCDYTAVADFRGDRKALRRWLSTGLPDGRHYYHLMGASHMVVDGDEATATTPCTNPMPTPDGGVGVFGIWYHDICVRTPDGWRIRARRMEFCYFAPLASGQDSPFTTPWKQPRDTTTKEP
jgi:hypothetical protein